MNCRDALDRMLEAEPALLRNANGDPALSQHLRTCERCRRVARMLASELAVLNTGLDQLASGPRAGLPASEVPRPSSRRARTRWRGRAAWVPLAAAAALAAVLVLGRDGGRPGAPGPLSTAREALPSPGPRVAVAIPADRGAAVMNTTNPKVTVVWFYERSEQ